MAKAEKINKLIKEELKGNPDLLLEEFSDSFFGLKEFAKEANVQIKEANVQIKEANDGIKEAVKNSLEFSNAISQSANDLKEYAQDIVELIQAVASVSKAMETYASAVAQEPPVIDFSPLNENLGKIHNVLADKNDSNLLTKILDGITSLGKQLTESRSKVGDEKIYASIADLADNIWKHGEALNKFSESQKDFGKKIEIMGGGTPGAVSIKGYDNPLSGRKTSTTPGTPVQLVSASTPCRRVDIAALPSNKNYIFIGDKNVLAVVGSEAGNPLMPLNTTTLLVSNLNSLWFDVLTSGDGVSYTYYS